MYHTTPHTVTMSISSDVVGPIPAHKDGFAPLPLEVRNPRAREYFRLKDESAMARHHVAEAMKMVATLKERVSWATQDEAKTRAELERITNDETASHDDIFLADLDYRYAAGYRGSVSAELSSAELALEAAREKAFNARIAEEDFVMSLFE